MSSNRVLDGDDPIAGRDDRRQHAEEHRLARGGNPRHQDVQPALQGTKTTQGCGILHLGLIGSIYPSRGEVIHHHAGMDAVGISVEAAIAIGVNDYENNVY